MKRYTPAFAIVALIVVAAFASAQIFPRLRIFQRCGPGGCERVPDAQVQPEGVQPAPEKVPAPMPIAEDNFGVDASKIGGGRVVMNGREVTMSYALGVIGGQIPDDSKKLRFTVIGSDAERAPVMAAFAQLDAETKARLTPWSVRPDHWSLKDGVTGQAVFKSDGRPTVYLQAPDGKVLHRQDDFKGADDFQAIRKAVKSYDAGKDVDLRKPDDKKPSPDAQPSPISAPIILLIVGAIVFFFWSRSNQS